MSNHMFLSTFYFLFFIFLFLNGCNDIENMDLWEKASWGGLPKISSIKIKNLMRWKEVFLTSIKRENKTKKEENELKSRWKKKVIKKLM